jgi:transcriptional regulator GlxA family with amidase domain
MLLRIDLGKSAVGVGCTVDDAIFATHATHQLTPYRLRQITEFIDKHLDQPLSVVEMAAHVGLSPSHFSRSFHRSLKMPPHRYLMARRLSRVLALLGTSSMPLAQIALLAGFCDQSHLSRYFRNHFGMTPRRFRRENRVTSGQPLRLLPVSLRDLSHEHRERHG